MEALCQVLTAVKHMCRQYNQVLTPGEHYQQMYASFTIKECTVGATQPDMRNPIIITTAESEGKENTC